MTQREREILRLIEAEPMIAQQELADRLNITRSSVAVHISNLTKKGYIAGKGYVLRSGTYAVVVGGVNIDIGGVSLAPLMSEDSNPGRVRISLGGVGRNIAHNMSLLDMDIRMLTALGDDDHGKLVSASCAELSIDISHALTVPGGRTPTYLYIAGPDGDMALAVNDMEICERITPEYLNSNLMLLNNAQVIIADTNLPRESLEFLANTCTPPLFVDTVSVAKAGKIQNLLGRIHTLKPNRLEAELLTGIKIQSLEDAKRAGEALLSTGLHRAFISLGGDGVYAVSQQGEAYMQNIPGNMVNTTGCGDAFMAALGWAYLEGMDLEETTRAGLAAASIAMESNETINPAMSVRALRERMNRK